MTASQSTESSGCLVVPVNAGITGNRSTVAIRITRSVLVVLMHGSLYQTRFHSDCSVLALIVLFMATASATLAPGGRLLVRRQILAFYLIALHLLRSLVCLYPP